MIKLPKKEKQPHLRYDLNIKFGYLYGRDSPNAGILAGSFLASSQTETPEDPRLGKNIWKRRSQSVSNSGRLLNFAALALNIQAAFVFPSGHEPPPLDLSCACPSLSLSETSNLKQPERFFGNH